jgi:uncharacterized Zn finger protein
LGDGGGFEVNLSHFEPHIDEKILVRGEKYFTDGRVVDMWVTGSDHYHAVVEGSIAYEVEALIDVNGNLLEHDCDCPYDWGAHCKHLVALLFAVRKHLQQDAKLKRKGKKQGLRSTLSRHSKESLVDLLCRLAADYDLREEIVYYLEDNSDDE